MGPSRHADQLRALEWGKVALAGLAVFLIAELEKLAARRTRAGVA